MPDQDDASSIWARETFSRPVDPDIQASRRGSLRRQHSQEEPSVLLGDMARSSIYSGNNVLTIEELSHEQLRRVADSLYGKPLEATCLFSDVHA